MPYRRAIVLYNPAAGRPFRDLVRLAGEAAGELRKWIPEVRLVSTSEDRLADSLALEAIGDGCDLIAVCGGDGTINEAIQGMAGSEAVLLPLPAGTANVLACETGLPVDPVKTARMVRDLAVLEAPLGVADFPLEDRRRYFLLMCGAGVDAAAVYRLNVGLKRRIGIAAYFWSALQQVFLPFDKLTVSVNGEDIECTLAVISKSRLYGGQLVLTPNAHLLDPDFDIACFPSRSPVRYAGYLAQVLTRTLDRFESVHARRSSDIEIRGTGSRAIYVQVDGELAGRLPARIRMGPERVRVLLPPAYCGRTSAAEVGVPVPAHG